MQKEANRHSASLFAKCPRERDQVIVVHPHEVGAPQQLHQVTGELGVDVEIAFPGPPLELAEVEAVVKHRPQRVVGEALVIALVIAAVRSIVA